MSGPECLLGVDFGTSHTVAMLRWPDGRTRPLLFDGQPLLPSAVYRDTTGRLHVGRDAVRLGFAEPGRLEPHPKRHVDAESVLLGDASVPVVDMIAAVLDAVAREAVAAAGSLPPAVVTYPAAWGTRRRDVLVAAVAAAGWPEGTRLVPEPIAAARYFIDVLRRPVPVGSSLAVFDFGAGTLDVAVVRHEGRGRFTVTADGGLDDLGGLDLDAALVERLGTSLAAAEPTAWAALAQPETLAQWRARRQFWDDVRGAKEMLSRSALAPIPVPGVERAVHLTRDELEAAVGPLVRRGVAEAGEVLAAAGVAAGDLAGLFLVGGSSRVPMVARLLHAELGVAPAVLEQPELPVAEGAVGAVLVDAPGPVPAARQAPDDVAAPPVKAAHSAVPAAAPASPEPRYAEPVDPWATGEAVALAAAAAATPPYEPAEPWLASTEPDPGTDPAGATAPAGRPRRFARAYLVIAGLLALLLAGGGTAAVLLWPQGAIEFRPLSEAVRIPPAVPLSSGFADAEVLGDRAYFAGTDDSGTLGVAAVDTGSGKQIWPSRDAGVAQHWSGMVALPDAVALLSDADSVTGQKRIVVLGANDGRKRWERALGRDDQVFFVADRVVVADRGEHRLLGLGVADGRTGWELPDIKTDTGTATGTVAATTTKDLSGPAGVNGRPIGGDLADDTRIVQIGADRSARVIDARSGKVQRTRQSVADADDELVAHEGRLIVAETDSSRRIVAYDLDTLGEPTVLYTAGTNRELAHLTACGKQRVCFVETTGYDSKTARAVSVDAADGKHWSRAAPEADILIPAGDALLVSQNTSVDSVTLLDRDGAVVWTRNGEAARVDAANILLFSKALTDYPDDPSVAGQPVGEEPVPLGPLSGVRSATCGWDRAVLACVAEKDFVLQRFAE